MTKRIDGVITDLMVIGVPVGVRSLPGGPGHVMGFLHTQAQLYTLKQFERAVPCPVVEILEIKTLVSSDEAELTAFFEGMQHECSECEAGLRAGIEGIDGKTYDAAGLAQITYTVTEVSA